jgi:hypothetical protein
MVNSKMISMVNELRLEVSSIYSKFDNELNNHLLSQKNGDISKDTYDTTIEPIISEMEKLQQFAVELKKFRMSYSEKNSK